MDFIIKLTTENTENTEANLFYLKCLLEYLKNPNNLFKIKDYEIIYNNKFNKG